jgi:threonine/homoserine/homoserine lactone efflux protein
MPGADLLLAFLAATAVFAYVPGPGMLYATAQTLAGGRRAGLLASLGLHLGGYVHVAAAAIGLSALFEAVPPLYLAVKLAGAAYLIWLGLGMILRGGDSGGAALAGVAGPGWRTVAHSFAVEVLNPKTALFFLAFLPQFVDPAAAWPVWLQLLALGAIVNLLFSSSDLVCIAAAGTLARALHRSRRLQRAARALGGGVLVGLGAHLALQRGS